MSSSLSGKLEIMTRNFPKILTELNYKNYCTLINILNSGREFLSLMNSSSITFLEPRVETRARHSFKNRKHPREAVNGMGSSRKFIDLL
jgi:hypothetical protein